jgi:hypothetical protein
MTKQESGLNSVPEAAADASSVRATARRVFTGLEPLWIALLVAGIAGSLLMVFSEFATLRSVKVVTASCTDLAVPADRGDCVTHGYEAHTWALLLLGVAALAMTWGATLGRSRPAAAALAAIGLAALGIALLLDVPDIHKTGVIGERYEQARAEAGPGLWMEIAGAALVFVSGVIALASRPKQSRRAARDRERRRRRATSVADA